MHPEHALWPAPVAPGELDAMVDVPGSKSLTNRHLLVAALGEEPVDVLGPLDSRDTRLMAAALTALGAGVQVHEQDGVPLWRVTPLPLVGADAGTDGSTEPVSIDCGLAGTVMRFVPAVAALLRRPVTFDGDAEARKRPVGPVIDALRELGAEVEGGEDGRLPFTVTGTDAVLGGEVNLDASGSSQFVSALLLAAPRLPRGLHVRHTGAALPSPQHIEMTLRVLADAGIATSTDADGAGWSVAPGVPRPGRVVVEPDLSNAGPFLGAALICGGTVRVPRWPEHTTQIGALWVTLLRRLGADVQWHDGVLTVSGTGRLTAIDVADTGELAPTLAALCALAEGTSELTGIAHLRGHETDRLAALERELNAVGVPTEELPDGLRISPVPGGSHAADWHSYADHRMATAGALIGLAVPGMRVQDIATTAKTLPHFTRMWERMLSTADLAATGAGA